MQTKMLSATLDVNDWGVIIFALGERPFKDVAQVISAINVQLQAQVSQPNDSTAFVKRTAPKPKVENEDSQ